MRIHHTGIITRNINDSIRIYEKLGYTLLKCMRDDVQNNNVAFLINQDSFMIELIEPIDSSSTVYNSPNGYHHMCYETNWGDDYLRVFQKLKIGKVFTKPFVAPAIDNRKVVFSCLKNGTIIEFIV